VNWRGALGPAPTLQEEGDVMNKLIEQYIAVTAPLFIALLWLTVTTLLGILSGWFRLMMKFPNRSDDPLLRLRALSATMGLGVSMRGILTVSACPSGLRVGMMRLFGPFCRDFLVPWESIAIVRKTRLFSPVAKLRFGDPPIGTLTISAHVADKLARATVGAWPEVGPFPAEKRGDTARRLLVQWALATCFAALFFTLVPMIVAPPDGRPPILVVILFPAIVCGVFAGVQYLRDRS
jgi:hypothetical protein